MYQPLIFAYLFPENQSLNSSLLGRIFGKGARMPVKRVRFVKSKRHLDAGRVMLEAVLGETGQTEIADPLIVHEDKGGYTDEVADIFEKLGLESP